RADAREDRALRRGGTHPDEGRARPWPLRVRRTTDRERAAALPDRSDLRSSQPVVRAVRLDAGADPAAGHATELLLRAAEHPALGLHVPAPGDAAVVPVGGVAAAPHALLKSAARDLAEGRRARGAVARGRGAGGIRDRDDRLVGAAVPKDAGLTGEVSVLRRHADPIWLVRLAPLERGLGLREEILGTEYLQVREGDHARGQARHPLGSELREGMAGDYLPQPLHALP